MCRLPSRFVDDANWHLTLISHLLGHMVLTGPQVHKWVKFYIFRLSYKLTSHDLWPSSVTFDLMNMWRFLLYINKLSLVSIRLLLSKWGEFYIFSPSYNLTSDDLWHWYMTFDHMNIQKVPLCINKLSLVPIRLQLFKWGHFHIFSLTTWPQMTFDLINKWGFLCCIYDPTLVEIHQSMWKLEPNVNLFYIQQQQQQQQRWTKRSLCVFPAEARRHKN